MLYNNISEIPIHLKGRVCIKLHMGEKGNTTHISPEDVRIIVNKIKENGGSAFLYDTTTLYHEARYTVEGYKEVAKENGFGEFEVVIGNDDDCIEVDGYEIPKEMTKADSLLLLTHATGHICTSFGGAVKNLGMGCVNKDGKRLIHEAAKPNYDAAKCTLCGACEKVCPCEIIKIENNKLHLNLVDCAGCGRCYGVCPEGAMTAQPNSTELSFHHFAKSAKAVQSLFKPENIQYITVAKNITKNCDCASNTGPFVCNHIGYLTADNPLKLDLETIELIKKDNPKALDWETWELFVKEAGKFF